MATVFSKPMATSIIRDLQSARRVRQAYSFFETHAEKITGEQITVCEIPASPFAERERAKYLCGVFRKFNLEQVKIDKEGNATGLRRGRELHPLLIVSAHLDTVFPVGTNFTVQREGQILRAPGVADDGCGIIALVALLDAMRSCEIETNGSLLFVGTVGEEGEGNLRGARYLLTTGEWKNQVDAFISLDGPGVERITNAALGSRRYQVRFAGAGGHSWGDFGVPNPIHAMGRAIARLSVYPLPVQPRTTFNIGRVEGGTSVNVIAKEAVMHADLRSESAEELARLDAYFRRAVHEALTEENAARHSGTNLLTLDVKLIGDRPSGVTAPDDFLVRLAQEATRAQGVTPRLDCSSTDSNIAISLKIPAITIGTGGRAANSHTLDEWYDTTNRHVGLQRDLLVLLGFVGLRE